MKSRSGKEIFGRDHEGSLKRNSTVEIWLHWTTFEFMVTMLQCTLVFQSTNRSLSFSNARNYRATTFFPVISDQNFASNDEFSFIKVPWHFIDHLQNAEGLDNPVEGLNFIRTRRTQPKRRRVDRHHRPNDEGIALNERSLQMEFRYPVKRKLPHRKD